MTDKPQTTKLDGDKLVALARNKALEDAAKVLENYAWYPPTKRLRVTNTPAQQQTYRSAYASAIRSLKERL